MTNSLVIGSTGFSSGHTLRILKINYHESPVNWTVWFFNAVMHLTVADGMANIVDPDQTAPKRSSLIWICTVC